jgi:release factor glutamine methyltransferase
MDCNLIHCKFAGMTIEEAGRTLISSLTGLYDDREAVSISFLVMERLTGMSRSSQLLKKRDAFSANQTTLYQRYLNELTNHRPVQYVLEEAWFGPYRFYVDEHVLIPRPETEELVNWLLTDTVGRSPETSIIDIGTGSGSIAIYIKKKRKDFLVSALDVEISALDIARKNGEVHHADVDFFLCDILDPLQTTLIEPIDFIISNPPYIPEKQRDALEIHVKDYEPGVALFVPDQDPILFYKMIGNVALQKLRTGGALFLEVHPDFAHDVVEWYEKKGFLLELRKDLSGNNRMIKAYRP